MYKLSKQRFYKISAYILAFTVVLCYTPYVFCQFLPLPSIKIMSVCLLLILFFLLISRISIRSLPSILNGIVAVQSLCWFLFAIYHNDSSYYTRILFLIISYLTIVLLLNTENGLLGFIRKYNTFILWMALMGMVCFFCVLFFSFSPLFEFENIDQRTAYCFGLTCTNTYLGNIIRYSGYFDEAGAMAYWGVFALIMNKLFFKNHRFSILLILSLTWTFSLAFYIQIMMYFLLLKLNSIKQYFIFFLSVLLIFSLITLSKDSDYDLYRFTLYRLEKNDSGDLQGDNRSELAQKAKKQFLLAPIMGIGAQKMESLDYMADNPYEILAKDGIIGFVVTYLPIFAVFVSRFQSRLIVSSLLILMVGYMQRPFHVNLLHYFVLYIYATMCILKFDINTDYE